ncbi:hypothetical protein CVT25_014092 [Psilocybe cyanescens]|uniref:Uncharacterized protein n=1 Tax=Psilocybe cyanescens TaxID=93625 RepID=A0A409XG22_PSICY|nr:hypothetical protein CVT25_014092 [Psilocybe cyanescens]
MFSRLLATLSSSLGRSQASLELKWMRHAIDSGSSHLSLSEMVRRRVQHEPLQYILGTQPFGPLNLLVRPPVLIPRPETEHWVTRLAESLSPTPQKPISLLDLGTGSGCIPLLLCHLWPPGSVKAHAVDISPHALNLAQDNAALCGIPSRLDDSKKPHNTFSVFNSDFLAEDFPNAALRINSSFDVITSNPPYIPWKEYIELPPSVLDFEDRQALLAGSSGLDFYHAIVRLVSHKNLLTPSAVVALEVGHNQAGVVETIMRDTGCFRYTEIWTDPWGKQRTVIARV